MARCPCRGRVCAGKRTPESVHGSGPEEDRVFTGIVEELGEVVRIDLAGDSARITIRGPLVTEDAARGDSIAINGVCLTVTGTHEGDFSADVMGETLARSSLGDLHAGAVVNLERPVRPDSRLGGHIVQGHVDGTGTIVAAQPGSAKNTVRIGIPADLARYLVLKGSVAVDGISLTISGLGSDWFEVSLIPETLVRTTLGRKRTGDVVNIEVDMIAKYVERLLEGRLQ
jgi:riboflavin synthase